MTRSRRLGRTAGVLRCSAREPEGSADFRPSRPRPGTRRFDPSAVVQGNVEKWWGCSGNEETDLWRSSLLAAAHPNRSYHRLDAERRRISARCVGCLGPSSRGNCKYPSPTLSFPLIKKSRGASVLADSTAAGAFEGRFSPTRRGVTGKQRNRRKTGRTVCRSMQIQR